MRGRRKLAHADFPHQVAEIEARRLTGYDYVIAARVELDGSSTTTYRPELGEDRRETIAALGSAASAMAKAFSLGAKSSLRVDLPGLGTLRAVGGSRVWSPHHYGVWIAITATPGIRAHALRKRVAESIARVDDYRVALPSMAPCANEAEALARRSLPQNRDLPAPYRPRILPRRHVQIWAEQTATAVNDAEYGTFEEWFAALDHDED